MLWTTALAALAQSVRGVVVDAVTLDTLAHATLQYADQPTPFSADAQGRFSLPRREGHVLRVSSVGYRTERVRITSRTSSRDLIIRLTPSDTQLAEVSVKAKRKKGYKRKGNPAVELMRRVIAAKERTNLERHDFYQYDKYQKITMAINNITPEELQGSLFASSPWLLGQVEVSEYNNQFVLPISVDERPRPISTVATPPPRATSCADRPRAASPNSYRRATSSTPWPRTSSATSTSTTTRSRSCRSDSPRP